MRRHIIATVIIIHYIRLIKADECSFEHKKHISA